MGIQGLFAGGKLPFRFRQALAAVAKWAVTAMVIVWVTICLIVSIITFLAGLFPATDNLSSKNNQSADQSSMR
jgi:hypothetical protein